jgi:hypothetical protein
MSGGFDSPEAGHGFNRANQSSERRRLQALKLRSWRREESGFSGFTGCGKIRFRGTIRTSVAKAPLLLQGLRHG